MSTNDIRALSDPSVAVANALLQNSAHKELTAFAKLDGKEALPVLSRLLSEPGYEAAAAEALGYVQNEEAAQRLLPLEEHASREVRRAAKQALFRLKSAGVAIARPQHAPEAAGKPEGAVASHVDGSGRRAVSILQKAVMGGLRETLFILGAWSGIEGVNQRMTSGSVEHEIELQVGVAKPPTKLSRVEFPVDYARWLVFEAQDVGRKAGMPAPKGLTYSAGVLGSSRPEFERPLAYTYVTTTEVRFDPTLLQESDRIFLEPEFADWYEWSRESHELLRQAADAEAHSSIVGGEAAQQRVSYLLEQAHAIAFDRDGRRVYQRMLEENALILWNTERQRSAKRAVAAAVSLAENDRSRSPFTQALIGRTFELLAQKPAEDDKFAGAKKLGLWVPS